MLHNSLHIFKITRIKLFAHEMRIFDGKNHHRGAYDRIALDVVLELLNGREYWAWIKLPPTSTNYTPEELLRADEVFLSTLRALVDQWINSGIRDDGTEMPSSRYVRPAPKGYSESLFEVLHGWLGRNMPKPALLSNGQIAIIDQRPELYPLDVDSYARETAIYYLKELFECPAPSRLGKCRNCGTYFARKRERRGQIKRGTYCGKCELIGAVERTRLSRQLRKNLQLEAAARAWPQWTKSHSHPNQAEWVARQVNKQVRTGVRIQAKWVTQNRKRILALTPKEQDHSGTVVVTSRKSGGP
jgi:hypothetical protein